MITIKKYRTHQLKRYRPFYDSLDKVCKDGIGKELLQLSALGARICYASDPPHILLKMDKRIQLQAEMMAFLDRCYKAGHFSVFAHTPLILQVKGVTYPTPYKAFSYLDSGKLFVCANLRHYVEYLSANNHKLDLKIKKHPSLVGPYYYDLVERDFLFEPEDNPYLMFFYYPALPWYWLSIVFHKVSRAMTHQLVRHTWLNFSQRSHRYTRTEGVVCPPSITDKVLKDGAKIIPAKQIFDEIVNNCKIGYQLLLNYGVPKEDARYIYPTGAESTIMASGPLFIWEDFVEKRTVKGSQWEIKNCAHAIKYFIEEILL